MKAALHARHAFYQGEWVVWSEVFGIDVLAMRFWSGGQGMVRVAYEVKVSRADFRQEIKKPEKRALAMELTHLFFFATPKGLVKPAEVPEGCGLVEIDDDGRVRVRVPSAEREPRWFTEREVSQLLRRDLFRSGAPRMKARIDNLEWQLELRDSTIANLREKLQRAGVSEYS